MNIRQMIATTVSFVSLLGLTPYVHASDCNELLELGYYNIFQSTSVEDSVTAAFRSFCSESYTSASSSKKLRIEGAWNYISGKLGYGASSVQEAQSKYCETTNNTSSVYKFESVNSQQIYQGALDAWTRCLELNAKGLHTDIRQTQDATAVVADLWWNGSAPISFTGIDQPDLGQANCIVTGSGRLGKPVTNSTRMKLSPKVATFTCSRVIGTTTTGAKFADRTRLTFKTEEGSFDVDLAPIHLTQVELSELDDLYSELIRLRKQGEVLETLLVPVDGTSVTSTTTLTPGVSYKVRVIGTAAVGVGSPYITDAEFYDFSNPPTSLNDKCQSANVVDMGVAINDPVNDGDKFPFWGKYQPTHIYTIDYIGQGAPLSFNYHDCYYPNNSGFLTVEILR